jgi:amino acid permease
MADFIKHLLDHRSLIILFILGVCLLGYGLPAYREATTRRYSWFWFGLGVLAIVGWFYFMFFGGA